jgi:hypothetical protein
VGPCIRFALLSGRTCLARSSRAASRIRSTRLTAGVTHLPVRFIDATSTWELQTVHRGMASELARKRRGRFSIHITQRSSPGSRRSFTPPRCSGNGARSAVYPKDSGGMTGGTFFGSSGSVQQIRVLPWTIQLRPRSVQAAAGACAQQSVNQYRPADRQQGSDRSFAAWSLRRPSWEPIAAL